MRGVTSRGACGNKQGQLVPRKVHGQYAALGGQALVAASGAGPLRAPSAVQERSGAVPGVPVPRCGSALPPADAAKSRAQGRAPCSAEASTRASSTSPTKSRASSGSNGGSENCAPSNGASELSDRVWRHRDAAHRPSDVRLIAAFVELCGVADVTDDNVKLLLRALKMLWCCDYADEDVCSILAHASLYFPTVFQTCGERMGSAEIGNVQAALMYLAHTWVEDQPCPLQVWHKLIFKKYCKLPTLRNTVLKLLEMREYVLRVDEKEMLRSHGILLRTLA